MELGLGGLNDEEKDKEADSMYTLGQNRQDLIMDQSGRSGVKEKEVSMITRFLIYNNTH